MLRDVLWPGMAATDPWSRRLPRQHEPAPPPRQYGPARPTWEYMLIGAEHVDGAWRARYINGDEMPLWMDGPDVAHYLASWGTQGWEAVSMTHTAPQLQFLLKRRGD